MEPAPTQFNLNRRLEILLAEDNLSNQRLLVYKFTRRGHKVSIAGNGLEALEQWRAGAYDLVLMDLMMPVMDGFEAARRIRAEEKAEGRKRTPIVALTANEDGDIRERCLKAGMDDYIAKPVTPLRLDGLLSGFGAASAVLSDEGLAPPSQDGLFDANLLGAVVNKPDRLVRYAELLSADLEREMGRLAEAVNAGDRDAIFRSAHAIKGAARPLKGSEMSALAEKMQLGVQAGSEEFLRTLLAGLREIYENVRLELKKVSLLK